MMKIDVNPSMVELDTKDSEQLILQKLNGIDLLKNAKKQLESDHETILKQKGKAHS